MKKTILYGTLLLLAACNRSGGGTVAPPANRAPVFTSATTASIAEGSSGVVYTAQATDPEGTSIVYAISGGLDAAAFAINASGALSFVATPDFERPTDADANNVYRVHISATDGSLTTVQTVDVTVTNIVDLPVMRRIATGFDLPIALSAYPDASGRVAVVEKAGRIRLLDPASGSATVFLDVSAQVSTTRDRGLLGLAFAPDYATSRAFYVFLTNLAGEIEVRRYQAQPATAAADPATANTILRIATTTDFHPGGAITFGPDGTLYIGTGDGVATRADARHAGGTVSLLGKILRIDPSRDDFPADLDRDYGVVAGGLGAGGEIWIYGFRDPRHASFDATTGDLWFADTGETFLDEINRTSDSTLTLGPRLFGWTEMEGSRFLDPRPGITGCCRLPVFAGAVDVGGYVYRGPVPSLRGQYFFADGATLNTIALDDIPQTAGTSAFSPVLSANVVRSRNAEFAPDAGSFTAIAGFGTDAAGNLFILDSDGEIFRLEGR